MTLSENAVESRIGARTAEQLTGIHKSVLSAAQVERHSKFPLDD